MDSNNKGAWIIHHGQKLKNIKDENCQYETISFASSCGILLSSIAATEEIIIPYSRMKALAKASGINTLLTLPTIANELKKQGLIDSNESQSEYSILGLTSASILTHTANIYAEKEPSQIEEAAIDISEKLSEEPLSDLEAKEYIADTFSLSNADTDIFLKDGTDISFFDYEDYGRDKLFFNGNIFRNDSAKKIHAVLSSLTQEESKHLDELIQTITQQGCISEDAAVKIAGTDLFNKIVGVGFFDVNKVSNEQGTFGFITLPKAFSKFNAGMVDDAFDLAKAFVTSLSYGMTKSSYGRGRIQQLSVLMNNLLSGRSVGPATAIGNDYKVLEYKGVIAVTPDKNNPGRYYMKLLKKDVGKLALAVLENGELNTASLTGTFIPSASISNYIAPEVNRVVTRKVLQGQKANVSNILQSLRTGGLK